MATTNTNLDYAIALYETTKNLNEKQLGEALKAFVEMLYRKGKLKRASSIIEAYISYAKKQEGIVDIEITTARPLDPKTLAAIEKAFGEKVESTQRVDSSILGGMKVQTGEKIFDASLRTQLERLKQKIS